MNEMRRGEDRRDRGGVGLLFKVLLGKLSPGVGVESWETGEKGIGLFQ